MTGTLCCSMLSLSARRHLYRPAHECPRCMYTLHQYVHGLFRPPVRNPSICFYLPGLLAAVQPHSSLSCECALRWLHARTPHFDCATQHSHVWTAFCAGLRATTRRLQSRVSTCSSSSCWVRPSCKSACLQKLQAGTWRCMPMFGVQSSTI